MADFNVLKDPLTLNQNYFLEASAGTGKTFAIEHIFLRLLLEQGLTLDKILVVTFTKAATAELKRRIRKTLEEALQALESGIFEEKLFLHALAKDSATVFLIKQKVRRSLALFDEAKIFTIHSFCASLLQEELLGKKQVPKAIIMSYLRDFLRTEANTLFTLAQWDKLLRHFGNDIEKLLEKTLHFALKKSSIVFEITLEAIYKQISTTFLELGCYELLLLKEDLCAFASLHKGTSLRDGSLKKEVDEEINSLEKLLEDPYRFSCLAKMQPENRLLKKRAVAFHYPHLIEKIEKELIPWIGKGLDEELLFATLMEKAVRHLEKVLNAENIFLLEDILPLMEQKLQDPLFCSSTQALFEAVLIDEFQDTDRTQWTLFKTLFLDKVPLFLIGDPKQSIYRFRGGDIYAYLEAKSALKRAFHGELSCNFRADPPLVEAINALFSLLQPFQTLPKTEQIIPYLPVIADPKKIAFPWRDEKKAIHFFEGKSEEALFAAFIQEIHTLHREYQIPYSSCAILVNDRYQALRFQEVAKKMQLHTLSKRNRSLTDSLAYSGLIQLLEAIIHSPDTHKLLAFLSGPLFACPHENLEAAQRAWLAPVAQLKKTLEKEGILRCFRQLMEEYKFYEKILIQTDGDRLYSDLSQLCDILSMEKDRNYISHLKKMALLHGEEEVAAYGFSLDEAAPIFTIHGSKGLEFDLVFAPGLIAPLQQNRGMVLNPAENKLYLSKKRQQEEQEELQAERMRLFYVAVTRAKKRVYLPLLENDEASIMGLFAAKTDLKNKFPTFFSHSLAETDSEYREVAKKNPCPALLLPKERCPRFTRKPITSFTKLAQGSYEEKKSPPAAALPLGPMTGTILHTILEKVAYTKFSEASHFEELIDYIHPFVHTTPLSEHTALIAAMLYKSFHSPLPVTPAFCLKDIHPDKVLKEVEFLYFCEEKRAYLKGFIDLCFEFEKKLYFVDWKTNYLENYDHASLLKEMESHHYALQRKIYQEALTRYSKLFPGIVWGGGFFIFLRALGENEGVCFE